MLRASIQHSGGDADVIGISEGAKAGDAGIEHGERLLAFVDAVLKGDAAEQATARDDLRSAASAELLVDAAAVIGNFERMVRIADATGIPLDGMVDAISGDLQSDLGLEEFAGRKRRSGGRLTALTPVLGSLARPIVSGALRIAGWRSRRG